ncbi:MFS transporter [Neiella marina]|uniref:MFS transporter n=1 Tax=Neiella holothuriorum TaxID=2870530 RepID=A0ABS7EDL4_9GAMM|nr:MFS transporter [Neiella holothuriorum]MBW8190420.1 MFS transporter [Neiella holothuriorum]
MQTSNSLIRRDIPSLSGAYFSFFAIVGLMVPYLSVYLDKLGYDSQEIGQVLALVATMRIVAPSLWSYVADKTGRHMLVARGGILLALLSLACLFWIDSRAGRLVALAAFNFFWTAVLPQVEVITLRKLAAVSGMYSKVRSAGSVGFIVISTLTGVIIAEYGPQAFVALGVLLSACLLMILLLLQQPAEVEATAAPQGADNVRFWTPLLIGLAGGAFFIQTSHGAYYSFFILHMVDLGFSEFAAGWLVALGVIAEILLFWRIGYLFSKFSLAWLYQMAVVLTVARWLLMAWYAEVIPLLLLSLVLHAASFGLIHACSMRWLHHGVAPQHQSKAQALYSGMGFGAGSVAGPALVAPIWQQGLGATQAYILCAAVAACAFIWFQFTLSKVK